MNDTLTPGEECRLLNRLAWRGELLQRVLPHAESALEAEAAVELACLAFPDPPDEPEGVALSWEPAGTGPGGIPRWKDTVTGRYRYQQTRPGSRQGAPEEPGGIKAQPKPDVPGRQLPGAPPEPQGLAPKPPEPPGRPREPQVKAAPATARRSARIDLPGRPASQQSPAQPPQRPQAPPKAPSPAQLSPGATQRLQALQGEQQKALADPNNAVNRLKDLQADVEPIRGGPKIRTIKGSKDVRLTPEDHEQVSAMHARLGGILQTVGNAELAQAHFAAARGHKQIAQNKRNEPRYKVAEVFKASARESRYITDEQEKEFGAAAQRVLSRMPDAAVARMSGVGKVNFFADTREVSIMFKNKLDPAAQERYKDVTIAGFYSRGDNTLTLDGGGDIGELAGKAVGGDIHGVYAHEMAHAVDGQDHELSRHKEWRRAFDAEINRPGSPLSKYGKKNAAEGFAEFGRLVYATDVPQAEVERLFPQASAYWKKLGIWPTAAK